MDLATKWLETAVPWVALGIPLHFTVAALLTGRFTFARADVAWRWAIRAGGLGLAAAAFIAVGVNHVPTVVSPLGIPRTAVWGVLNFRMDVLSAVMLSLVAFLGWVVLRFSRNYLNGDAGQLRYLRWLQLTLAAVTLLVQANNLLVIALAWMGTSLALHNLLTYYGRRPQALVAAHKKFLLSRLADISLFGAVFLVGSSQGTLELDQIFAAHNPAQPLPFAMHAAMTLLALTAILKCAQLPFHGWLIQVMEAPTPVSALLHAGVVNLGGFVLIRLSPLLSHAELAQNLLLVVGALTATGAALVMMTRISVKVMLAWSTCAQMGLMLVQCSLGAYSLALLHLVAHSLYKAHAFLSSGNAVAIRRELALAPRVSRVGFAAWMLAAVASVSLVALTATLVGIDLEHESSWWLPAGLVALSLPALFLRQLAAANAKTSVYVLAIAAIVPALYYLWHGAFASMLPQSPTAEPARDLASLFALAAFAVLYIVHAWVSSNPSAPFTQWLFRYAYNGFYLDELFTRLTFRIWPPKITSLESQNNAKPSISLAV
jgi:NAD(P)H-quinone oxidoreductase subunit 5